MDLLNPQPPFVVKLLLKYTVASAFMVWRIYGNFAISYQK